MSTVVYLLWHDDHDGEYGSVRLRGLYFDETEARKDLPVEVDEWTGPSRRRSPYATVTECRTVRHNEDCCSIDQETIRDHAIGAVALPEKPYVPMTGERLINEATERYILDLLVRPNIFHRSADAHHEG